MPAEDRSTFGPRAGRRGRVARGLRHPIAALPADKWPPLIAVDVVGVQATARPRKRSDRRRRRSRRACTVHALRSLAGGPSVKASYRQAAGPRPNRRPPRTHGVRAALAARSSPPPVVQTTAALALRAERIEATVPARARPAARGARGLLGKLVPSPRPSSRCSSSEARTPRTRHGLAGHVRCPAAAPDQAHGTLLRTSMDASPSRTGAVPSNAVGARDEEDPRRSAKTAFIHNPKGARAAYTILSGRHDRRTVGRVREEHERREAVHHDA